MVQLCCTSSQFFPSLPLEEIFSFRWLRSHLTWWKVIYHLVFFSEIKCSITQCQSQIVNRALFWIGSHEDTTNKLWYLYLLLSFHGHLCLPLLLSILLNCSINWFPLLKGEYLKISSVSTAYFSGSEVIGSLVFKSHEGRGTITFREAIMEANYSMLDVIIGSFS